MMQYIRPFSVAVDGTYALTVTGTAASITLPGATGNRSVRIVVKGTSDVYWQYGGAAAIPASGANATGTYMLAQTIETFFLPRDVTTMSFIGVSTGSTVYVTIGESA
jgi:NADH:ubiquinone oxidoreductase subunit 4 (subunit M)